MAINSGQYSGNAAEERWSPAVDGGQKDGKRSESKRFKELLFCMVRDCRLSMMATAVVVTLTVYFVLAVTGLFYGFIKLLILGWLLYSLPVAKMQRFQQFLLDLLKRMKQFLDFSLKIKNLELEKKAGNDDKPMIVSFGEMLIDFVPDVAGVPLAKATGFLKAPGGAPANVACAVAKLGGNSAFIGKVGEDEFGKMLAEILKEHNVNLDGLRFDKVARTALAFVTLKTNGEGDFMFYRNLNADMMLEESELNMGLIKRARVFHYGSISLISEPCRSAHIAAMETAKRTGGVLLSYDPNVRLPLWDSPDTARNEIKSIWEYADIIKVSGEEVEFLTGGDPEDDLVVLKLWHENLKLLVVTYGEKGCRYYTKNFLGRIPGFSVKTVDATGAGDAFVGSLLVSIVEEDDSIFSNWEKLKKALTLANACGAICTTKKGAIPALPTMADAQNLVNKVTAEQGI